MIRVECCIMDPSSGRCAGASGMGGQENATAGYSGCLFGSVGFGGGSCDPSSKL
jgi:hypothetical protein